MKVLVTGANGLLGSHVVRELLKNNYEVRVLVRKGSDLRALEGLDVELFNGQITRQKDVVCAVKDCDFVIHAAARTAQSSSALETFERPNIESTKYIIEACKMHNVKRLLFVSTANCFGNGTKENPGDETKTFLPWLKNSGYAYSKYLAQQLVLNEVKNNRLDAVVVNPTFIIGENDFKPSSGQIFSHVLNKRVVFYPPGGKNFVDAEMAALGVVKALKKGTAGECYLLAGENHSYQEFFKMVKNITGQKTIFIPLPKCLLLVSGLCGSLIESIFRVPVQLTYTNARMLCLGNYFSAEKAGRELGLTIVPTIISTEKAILWFKAHKYFK